MANCVNCGIEVEQQGNRPKLYCSARCKTAFRRKGSIVTLIETNPIVTSKNASIVTDVPKGYIKDAAGTLHKIDYEGRRKTQKLLDGWAEGKGTPYQERLGKLAQQWDKIIGGSDKNTYLGYTM